ncbi:hypothetical protein [Corynebacterium glyciniphilum]|nr:hypothetical protein [Corynebacterium glyciniphilum]
MSQLRRGLLAACWRPAGVLRGAPGHPGPGCRGDPRPAARFYLLG